MRYVLEASVKKESGYTQALQGLALNKKQFKDMDEVALRLSQKDFGHNKFLEAITLWILVLAPRYWWQEADTYRISTKQSESTMHTLITELELQKSWGGAFEHDACISPGQIKLLEDALQMEDPIERLVSCKQLIPEGFLQTRMWCMSYKTLRNIATQRRNHRLPHWRSFLEKVYAQIEHPEFLPKL